MNKLFEILATAMMGINILYAVYLYIKFRRQTYTNSAKKIKVVIYVYILLLVCFFCRYIEITSTDLKGVVQIFISQIMFWGSFFVMLSLYVLKYLYNTVSKQFVCDISDLKMSLDTYIESIPGGIHHCVLDPEPRVIYVSRGFTDITGYTMKDINSRYHGKYIGMVYEEDRDTFIKGAEYLLKAKSTITTTYRIISKRGEIIWLSDSANIVEDTRGVRNVLSVVMDITNEMSNVETDSLTKLLNKGAFNSKVKEYMALNSKKNFGLFMIDLNYFKEVNDRFGHQSGDIILMKAADYLREAFSDKDSIIGRVGGDEFMVLVKDIESDQSLMKIKDEVNSNFASCIYEKKNFPTVTASVGFTFANCSEDFEDVFRRADFAMYDEKELMHAKRK